MSNLTSFISKITFYKEQLVPITSIRFKANVFCIYSFTLLKTAATLIPNKIITVRKTDATSIYNIIRRAIRKRNRLNKSVKKSNLPEHWSKFRKFRNKTVNLILKEKQVYIAGLVAKLHFETLSIRSWWITASHLAGLKSRESDIPTFRQQ